MPRGKTTNHTRMPKSKVPDSPEYVRWVEHDQAQDPLWRDPATTSAWSKKVIGNPHTQVQPPACSLDRYFPQSAAQWGLVRYHPTSVQDLHTPSRGTVCQGGKKCHSRDALPAFMYIHHLYVCAKAASDDRPTVLTRWSEGGKLQACQYCFVKTFSGCLVGGVQMVRDKDEDEDGDGEDEVEDLDVDMGHGDVGLERTTPNRRSTKRKAPSIESEDSIRLPKSNKGKGRAPPVTPSPRQSRKSAGTQPAPQVPDASSSAKRVPNAPPFGSTAAHQSTQPRQVPDASSSATRVPNAPSFETTAAGQSSKPPRVTTAPSVATQVPNASSFGTTAAGQSIPRQRIDNPPLFVGRPPGERTGPVNASELIPIDGSFIHLVRNDLDSLNETWRDQVFAYSQTSATLLDCPLFDSEETEVDIDHRLEVMLHVAHTTFQAIESLSGAFRESLGKAGDTLHEGYDRARSATRAALKDAEDGKATGSRRIEKLSADLEASERSAAKWNKAAGEMEKKLKEAVGNTDERVKGLESERDTAIADHEFSESRRLELQRKYDELVKLNGETSSKAAQLEVTLGEKDKEMERLVAVNLKDQSELERLRVIESNQAQALAGPVVLHPEPSSSSLIAHPTVDTISETPLQVSEQPAPAEKQPGTTPTAPPYSPSTAPAPVP